jgi:hypothetical protein
MHVCFLDAQDIEPPPSKKNIHHDVDLLSLELIIQLVSQYPFNTIEKLE